MAGSSLSHSGQNLFLEYGPLGSDWIGNQIRAFFRIWYNGAMDFKDLVGYGTMVRCLMAAFVIIITEITARMHICVCTSYNLIFRARAVSFS